MATISSKKMFRSQRVHVLANGIGLAVLLGLLAGAPALAEVTAEGAFDRLKELGGTWKGVPEGEGAEAEAEAKTVGEVVHEFRVSANESVVMETMGPGTEYEMINMYHLDGDELVLTHYCSSGNQPVMRLDLEASSEDVLVFDFAGGTNLDPATDHYIHSAKLSFGEDDRLESAWTSYGEGKKAGGMTFHLARAK